MIYFKRTFAIVLLSLLAACGGGGGTKSNTTPTVAVIKGVASKGIIANGTVTVFALNADGSKGAQLGTGSTDGTGAYSISIGSYTGPVIAEAYGGYTDEATGLPMTVPALAPLRAVLANVSGTVSLSVTPLSDLAVRQAGTLTAQNIAAANTLISDLFNVDIVATAPVAPSAGAFQASTTTQAQKDYAIALAAISQQMQTGGTDLAATLSSLNSGISAAGMTPQTAATIIAAGNNFIAGPKNLTGVTSIADTSLQTVGSTTMKLNVVLQGSAAASVKGIQATINFPAGAVLKADATGKLLSGVMTPATGTPSVNIEGKYTAVSGAAPATVTVAFVTSNNLTAGDFVTLTVDLSPSTSVPAASAFIISSSKLVDADGVVVSGASLALR
jgi:hypothetical protein